MFGGDDSNIDCHCQADIFSPKTHQNVPRRTCYWNDELYNPVIELFVHKERKMDFVFQ